MFYTIGFVAIVLVIAGLLLSLQNDDPAIAAAATAIGAIGFLTCARMLKRR
jgi:hypothetical protein